MNVKELSVGQMGPCQSVEHIPVLDASLVDGGGEQGSPLLSFGRRGQGGVDQVEDGLDAVRGFHGRITTDRTER